MLPLGLRMLIRQRYCTILPLRAVSIIAATTRCFCTRTRTAGAAVVP
ncbi:MAG: hypothetical protein LBF88_06560 [Planctomycetaceae bacterium]|nr:hypothetical protein [Planctomycetaceae bacterium]